MFPSGIEWVVVMLAVLLLFGAKKIPELARGLGQGINEFKKASNDIKKEINESAKKQGIDTDLAGDIQKEIDQVKDNIDDMTGPIKRSM